MKRTLFSVLLIAGLLLASIHLPVGAASTAKTTRSYLIISKTTKLPTGLDAKVKAIGGKVTSTIPKIGVAVVRTTDAKFAAKAARISGVRSVVPNLTLQWMEPEAMATMATNPGEQSQTGGPSDPFMELQWSLVAIQAPQAWEMGYSGEGVRVAVLDGGFDLDHYDLAQNIDLSLSKSFVPGEKLAYAQNDSFSHGTHVAGIIAAANNGFGTIGVAPKAKLMLVKVVKDAGSGEFSWMLQGIAHAAAKGAKVINISLGGRFDMAGYYYAGGKDPWKPISKRTLLEYRQLVNRAVSYANSRGAIVIAAAGNDGAYRSPGSKEMVLPADAPGVLSVSATGPRGWAKDKNTSLDLSAWYSNYGQKAVDLAAPGGNYDLADNGNCTVAGFTRLCYAFDLVFSTGSTPGADTAAYFWTSGTSMAAAHVSGVAALLIDKEDGKMPAGNVKARLLQSVDDIGDSGRDIYFGVGRINALTAVQ